MATIEFNVKFATMMKILSGEKKKFERDISDIETARQLFLLTDDGDCALNESAKEEMIGQPLFINSITRRGNFPFILKHYDTIKFTNTYGSSVIADVDGVHIYRHDRYWRISYRLKNVVKIR